MTASTQTETAPAAITAPAKRALPAWLTSLLQGAASLGLALVFNQGFRFRQAYLSTYYLPAVISLTVWSLVWLFMYNPSFGLFSEFARWLGFRDVRMLDNPATAMPAMILLSIWKGAPVYMLIFLAGLRAIPGDYYEAAKVDGASALQRLWSITLPLLRPVFLYVVVISIIGAFQAFTPMYLLTMVARSILKRSRPSSPAITSAAMVLPVPDGPEKRTVRPRPSGSIRSKPHSESTRSR